MNTIPRHSIDPAYFPHLIQPEFPLPAAEGEFIPFKKYLDGVFLFYIGGEFIAMDALGRTLAKVRARSADLVRSSIVKVNLPTIQVSLKYEDTNGEHQTIVRAYKSQPLPAERPCDFSSWKHPNTFSRLMGFFMEHIDPEPIYPKYYEKMKVFGRYDEFSNFSEGFSIAKKGRASTYFDERGRQLILFKRMNPDTEDARVYCVPLDKASPFRDSMAVVTTSENCKCQYAVLPSGRCLGDRGWDEVRPVCGGLIPVRSKEDGGWTLMNRAGDLLGSYYEQIYVTPTGAAFIPNGSGYRCIIPFSDDQAAPLRWQQIQEAEPGLLWAIRDGRHELIDCRTNRLSPLTLYASHLEKTHSLSLHQEDDVVFLRAQGNAWFDVSAEDFFGYIDFLQQSCGLKYSFSGKLGKEGFHMLGFEGGRFHSPMKTIIDGTVTPCSLYIVYQQMQDRIRFTAAMPAMRQPVVPAADDAPLRQESRIILPPKTIDKICRWQRHNCNAFCDYLYVNLDYDYGDSDGSGGDVGSSLSEHDPDDPWDTYYYGWP